jgi:hypothetical protein
MGKGTEHIPNVPQVVYSSLERVEDLAASQAENRTVMFFLFILK